MFTGYLAATSLTFSRESGVRGRRGSVLAVVGAAVALLAVGMSPAQAGGSMSGGVGETVATPLPPFRPGTGPGEEPCVNYISLSHQLAWTTGTVTHPTNPAVSYTGPVAFSLVRTSDNRFEGPSGSYKAGDPTQVTATGCVISKAGSTNQTGYDAPTFRGRTASSALTCTGGTGKRKRVGSVTTLEFSNVSCTIATSTSTSTFTQAVTVQSTILQCDRPIAPGLCTQTSGTATFSP